MIKTLIYSLLERRHYWRYVSFSEIAEIYASRTLRVLAVSMVSVFIGIYLYQNNYSITFILLYFAAYFLHRAWLTVPFAYLIARIGPKHATLLSNLLYVPALLLLVMLPSYGVWALAGCCFLQGMSVTLYEMSYLVDFSKVHHGEHAGKEISYMHILDGVAKGASPMLGGFIAYWVNPQATLFFAAAIFAVAAVPLFFTPEPVKTHQRITFHGVPWSKLYRGLRAEMAVGVDYVTSSVVWSLFLALAVFGIDNNAVYAQIGVLSGVTVLASVIASRMCGVLVDRWRGKELLTTGVVVDALTHIGRVFVATPFSAMVINIVNEIATVAFVLPFTKGMFAQADTLPGYRIVYMSLMSCAATLGAALFCTLLAGISLYIDEVPTLQIGYVIASLTVLIIIKHGFMSLLKPRLFG